MRVTAVESTTLSTIVYDEAHELLRLEFCRSQAVYQYFGVPATVYEALLGAASKGGYFNRVIRGRFRYALVSSAQAALAEGSR